MSVVDALLAGPLAAMTVGGILFGALGAGCVRLWQGEQWPEVDARELPPLTLLRPVKPGVPALRAKLEALVRAMRAGDQLVLGADEGSNEFVLCDAVRGAFLESEIVVVACRFGAALNPKISKLLQMDAHARHEHLVLSDSEALIDLAWLESFRNEWAASGAQAITAPYRFAGLATGPQRADAAATLLSLWPGLALVRAFSPVRFTLGACTGMRRGEVAAEGGWAAFGDYLAEDHRLGAALAASGVRIRLSTQVATLESDALTWGDFWRHQRRVAVTYRVCNPRGFAGMIATHGVTASVIVLLLAPFSSVPGFWLAWASATLAGRWLTARALHQVTPIPELWRVMIPAALVETACWVLSWFVPVVSWAGRWWSVTSEGRMAPRDVEMHRPEGRNGPSF